MSGQHEYGSASIRSRVFKVPEVPVLLKSCHLKRDDGLNRRQSADNLYKFKKKTISKTVKSEIHCDTKPHQVVSSTKPQQSIKSCPLVVAINNTSKRKEERVSTNIHVNPLFASKKSGEQNVTSCQQLPNKLSTSLNQLLSKSCKEVVAPSKSFNLKIPNPLVASNLTNSQSTSTHTSVKLTASVATINRPGVSGDNQHALLTESTSHCSITTRSPTRSSIHVNPSILVSNYIQFPKDCTRDKPIQLQSDILNLYNSLQRSPNAKVTSVHINPQIHGTKGTKPASLEIQRSVHINPAVLASHAVKKAVNAKASVHVNPKVYARLKSEVRREKPSNVLVIPSTISTSQVEGFSPVNKSLFTITRTKLVRASLPQSRKLSTRKSQSTFQPVCNTPKFRKLYSKTPSSAVVKVARSVCTKYKFIRKSFQATPSSTPEPLNKVSQILSSKFKLDRRSQKTPKYLKKVKQYSVKYEGSRRNYLENNAMGIMVNKKLVSAKKLSHSSRVWRNPISLPIKKVVSKNRKLFRNVNSPSQKTKGNQSSSHKTLVRLGGVLYKTSRMKLTRTRTPKNKCARSKTINTTPYRSSKKSINRGCILNVRGDRFLMDPLGRTLKRISKDKPSGNVSSKRIDIGGVTFIQKSKNVLIRTNTHTVRSVLSQAKNKSIALLTMRMRKNNTQCRFYRRLGKCTGKEKGRCPCIHDPKYVMICKKLLKGECNGEGCLLSHELISEKMPACKFFLQGCCARDVCPYLHAITDFDAPICTSFLQGYCQDGSKCLKRHLYVCPLFDKTGKCPKSKYCPYPHKSRESFKLDIINNVENILETKDDESKVEGFRYFRSNVDNKCELEEKIRRDKKRMGRQSDALRDEPGTNIRVKVERELQTNRRTHEIAKLFLEAMSYAKVSNLQSLKRSVHKIVEMQLSEHVAQHDMQFLSGDRKNEMKIEMEVDNKIAREVAIADTVLMSKTIAQRVPVGDEERKKIVRCKQRCRQHQEEIYRLLQERAHDRNLMLNGKEKIGMQETVTGDLVQAIRCICRGVKNDGDCFGGNGNFVADKASVKVGGLSQDALQTQIKTKTNPQLRAGTLQAQDRSKLGKMSVASATLINYVLQKCDQVCQRFNISNLVKRDSAENSNGANKNILANVSAIKLCKEVCVKLRKVIEFPSKFSVDIGKDGLNNEGNHYFSIPPRLVKLLENLLTCLTKSDQVCENVVGLAVPTLFDPNSAVRSHTEQCQEHNLDEVSDDLESNSSCSDNEEVDNFFSRRPKIGSLPSYIPFN